MSIKNNYNSGEALAATDWNEAARKANIVLDKGVIQNIIPRSGDLYAFGDSQTFGANYGTSSYTDQTTHRLLTAYRWVNQLATANGRSLAVNNFAWSGSRLSYDVAASSDSGKFSHFNMTGLLPHDWSGIIAAMCGWNSLDASNVSDAYFTLLKCAHQAMIAKFLIDDWAGVTYLGWPRNGGSSAAGFAEWTTDGANNNSQVIADTAYSNYQFGFPVSSGPFATRFRTNLTAGQSVQFRLTNKRAIALFYETDETGGSFDVLVNGVVVNSYSNQHTSTGGNDVGSFTKVVWIEAPPANATVKLLSTNSGHVFFMAFGWIDIDSALLKNKRIVYGTTSGNIEGRNDTVLYKNAVAAENAVSTFSNYPVYLSSPYTSWVQSTDSDTEDPAHLTPSGAEHIVSAYEHSYKPFARLDKDVFIFNPPAQSPSGINGSGAANALVKWIDEDTLADSFIHEDGTGIGVNTDNARGAKLHINSSSTDLAGEDVLAVSWGGSFDWAYIISQRFTGSAVVYDIFQKSGGTRRLVMTLELGKITTTHPIASPVATQPNELVTLQQMQDAITAALG